MPVSGHSHQLWKYSVTAAGMLRTVLQFKWSHAWWNGLQRTMCDDALYAAVVCNSGWHVQYGAALRSRHVAGGKGCTHLCQSPSLVTQG